MAIDRTERLLNLVICLLGAERPVSRAALRASIPGYAGDAGDDAFERMFERDKDELRQMGIPVETVVNSQGEVEGYLIDEDTYAMPDLDLDTSERAVLGLAARAWSEATLAAQASSALRKIEASTGARWAPILAGRPTAGEEHLPLLWEAIRSRAPVRFDYLARGRDAAEQRTVEPWATVHRGGAWYLVGHSRERQAGRAFRLSRVTGAMTRLREEFPAAGRDDVDRLVDELGDPSARGVARVILPQTGGAWLRRSVRPRADGSGDVDYADITVLVAEVIEAGGAILEPPDAVTLQLEALRAVCAIHGDDDA